MNTKRHLFPIAFPASLLIVILYAFYCYHAYHFGRELVSQSVSHAIVKRPYPPGWTNETELSRKIKARDGTNYLGTYLGMIAEWDGQTKHYDAQNNRMYGNFPQQVMMFSATSGELLKWIPYSNFLAIFVDRTQPEYR
jgi:hypothetical protein